MQKYKATGYLTLFDEEERQQRLSKIGNPLEKLSMVIDFEMFRDELEDAVLNKDIRRSDSPNNRQPWIFTIWSFTIWLFNTQLFLNGRSYIVGIAADMNHRLAVEDIGIALAVANGLDSLGHALVNRSQQFLLLLLNILLSGLIEELNIFMFSLG